MVTNCSSAVFAFVRARTASNSTNSNSANAENEDGWEDHNDD